ncbi:hypothetical protein GG851_13315 [Bordetella petrii]|nr:hypothetical protein [Bordetella petrii]
MPAIRTAIEQQGSIVAPLPASDFGKFLQSDKARWERILQQSGFTPAS